MCFKKQNLFRFKVCCNTFSVNFLYVEVTILSKTKDWRKKQHCAKILKKPYCKRIEITKITRFKLSIFFQFITNEKNHLNVYSVTKAQGEGYGVA